MGSGFRIVAALLGGLAFTAAAHAADCGPLKITATVTLKPTEDRLEEFVPVRIDGKDKLFLFDTGGYDTQIAPAVVKELGLTTVATQAMVQYIGGKLSPVRATTPDRFEMGGLQARKMPLSLIPDEDTDIDGIVAIDLLLSHDVDLDFGHDKMNLVSPDHCSGKVIYWPAQAVAELPLRIVNGHYLVGVDLDGQQLVAILDTGATRTSIGTAGAFQHFGLSPDSPDMAPTDKVNGNATTYLHKFGVLKLDGIELHTPTLAIIQTPLLQRERAHRGFEVFGEVRTPWDMVLGMDMLRHFHVYIATEERKVYLTPVE